MIWITRGFSLSILSAFTHTPEHPTSGSRWRAVSFIAQPKQLDLVLGVGPVCVDCAAQYATIAASSLTTGQTVAGLVGRDRRTKWADNQPTAIPTSNDCNG